jgi:hypothetical protein
MELVGPTARDPRPAADSSFRLVTYPSAAYGFLGFKSRGQRRQSSTGTGQPGNPPWSWPWRWIATALAHSIFGPSAVAPPGPMSRLLWIWSDSIRTLPFDTARGRGGA